MTKYLIVEKFDAPTSPIEEEIHPCQCKTKTKSRSSKLELSLDLKFEATARWTKVEWERGTDRIKGNLHLTTPYLALFSFNHPYFQNDRKPSIITKRLIPTCSILLSNTEHMLLPKYHFSDFVFQVPGGAHQSCVP